MDSISNYLSALTKKSPSKYTVVFFLVLALLGTAYYLFHLEKYSSKLDQTCSYETDGAYQAENDCTDKILESMQNLHVVNFPSPDNSMSVNLWFFTEDKSGEKTFKSFGNVIDNNYSRYFLWDSHYEMEQFEGYDSDLGLIFSNMDYDDNDGYGSFFSVNGFLRWLNNSTFMLRKNNGLVVIDVIQKKIDIIEPPDERYKLVDIDRDLNIVLMELDDYSDGTESERFVLYDLRSGEEVDFDMPDSARIREYDYYTDRFVFYPTSSPTSNTSDILLFDPVSMSSQEYSIPRDMEVNRGRGCGGWHLLSDTPSVLKIHNRCDFFAESDYINEDGLIEINL